MKSELSSGTPSCDTGSWLGHFLFGDMQQGRQDCLHRQPHFFELRGGEGKSVFVDQFLVLHETVERSPLDRLGLVYQHARRIAVRAEEAAVRTSGVSWRQSDRFMQVNIKDVGHERLERIPPDLDIKPYRDEQDFQTLRGMQDAIWKELGSSPDPLTPYLYALPSLGASIGSGQNQYVQFRHHLFRMRRLLPGGGEKSGNLPELRRRSEWI